MAKNDVILLDGIIDERTGDSSVLHGRDEVFELFVLEQVLKDFDLSADEIEAGWTDGGGDGGIDGFYIFINGHYSTILTSLHGLARMRRSMCG